MGDRLPYAPPGWYGYRHHECGAMLSSDSVCTLPASHVGQDAPGCPTDPDALVRHKAYDPSGSGDWIEFDGYGREVGRKRTLMTVPREQFEANAKHLHVCVPPNVSDWLHAEGDAVWTCPACSIRYAPAYGAGSGDSSGWVRVRWDLHVTEPEPEPLDLPDPPEPSITIRRDGGIPPWTATLTEGWGEGDDVYGWTEAGTMRRARRKMRRRLARDRRAADTRRVERYAP